MSKLIVLQLRQQLRQQLWGSKGVGRLAVGFNWDEGRGVVGVGRSLQTQSSRTDNIEQPICSMHVYAAAQLCTAESGVEM
jgi:hypothetical protein